MLIVRQIASIVLNIYNYYVVKYNNTKPKVSAILSTALFWQREANRPSSRNFFTFTPFNPLIFSRFSCIFGENSVTCRKFCPPTGSKNPNYTNYTDYIAITQALKSNYTNYRPTTSNYIF